MPTRFKTFALAAALVAGTSSVALAQYACPAGYAYSYGACRPVAAPARAPAYPSNPVSGAVSGEQAGAAQGAATGGPVGAIVGGAIGTAVATSAGLLAPYVMGSVVETAATPLAGFNTGFMICGVIMLVGGAIGIALMRPEREMTRWASEIPAAAVPQAAG